MKPRTERETKIICVAAVIVVALLTIPFELESVGPDGVVINQSRYLVWIAVAGVIALGMVLGYRYLTTRKRAQVELTGGEQYRKLAEEYRRLADLAITAQEHTDLKLGDVSASSTTCASRTSHCRRSSRKSSRAPAVGLILALITSVLLTLH